MNLFLPAPYKAVSSPIGQDIMMKKLFPLFLLTPVFLGCDSPDVPEYNTKITTDAKEYVTGDSVLVSIESDFDQPVYVSTDLADSTLIDYQLQQKTTENWKTVLASHPVPSGKVVTLQPGGTVQYKFKLPAVPDGGVNIFRVNHRIFLSPDLTKSVGTQQTLSNPFFIYE